MRTMFSVVAFVGAVGLSGAAQARDKDQPIQPTREGRPPSGVIRSEFMLRAAHDGRAETGIDVRQFRATSARQERADSNVGQAHHFALPVRSDILQRVSLGDGREAAKGVAVKNNPEATTRVARSYRDLAKPHLPIPIKMEVKIRLEAASVDFDKNIDDPKVLRGDNNKIGDRGSHRDPKVYPGRHEDLPTVPEMFMKVSKRKSAQGDSPGDKDAG
jgi:hypothetical protein